jgi:hypothetical protein
LLNITAAPPESFESSKKTFTKVFLAGLGAEPPKTSWRNFIKIVEIYQNICYNEKNS